MAIQVITPLHGALDEIRRVPRPRGLLVALLPARRPLGPPDRVRHAKLSLSLRRRVGYPNDHRLAGAAAPVPGPALTIIADEHRRFVYQIAGAEELVRSLYLPGVPATRIDAATRVVAKWRGKGVGIPLRRLIAQAP